MTTKAEKLATEIGTLSDVEKLHLLDSIIADLDRPDPAIDRIWADEARKRWAAHKAGRSRAASYEEVMADCHRP
ncbi:MAG: addiction module protein [Candidatus Methylomirabilia bacterium]